MYAILAPSANPPAAYMYIIMLKASLDNADPSLFHQAQPNEPPIHLSSNAIRATVLASASSYPAAASALAAVRDIPVPDPALSASLTALVPRMKGVEALQAAQRAEVAELRARSEEVVRRW